MAARSYQSVCSLQNRLSILGGIMDKAEYQKTIDYIFDLIESGMVNNGDQLPTERMLAERLGISRNAIREALRTLENLGLVECRQGSGTYLTDHVSDTFTKTINIMLMLKHTTKNEICSFRRHMEKAVCSYIITNKCPQEQLDIIWQSVDALLSAADIPSLVKADTDFHYALINAAQNSFMTTIMEPVSDVYRKWIDEIQTICPDELRPELLECHRLIAEGISNGDYEACVKAIDRHYNIVDSIGGSY